MFSTFVQTKVAKAYRGGASEVTSSNNRMCGVHGKRDIPYFTPAAQMRFPLYPAARVPRRRCTLYPVPGYGGDLLIAF